MKTIIVVTMFLVVFGFMYLLDKAYISSIYGDKYYRLGSGQRNIEYALYYRSEYGCEKALAERNWHAQ